MPPRCQGSFLASGEKVHRLASLLADANQRQSAADPFERVRLFSKRSKYPDAPLGWDMRYSIFVY